MTEVKSFKSQISNTLQSSFFVSIIGFLTTILISRVLGAELRGVFTFLTTLPSIIVTLGRFGFAHSIVYNINVSDKNKVIYTSFFISIISGLLLMLLTLIGIKLFTFQTLENIKFEYLIISSTLIPLFFISDVLFGSLQGLKKIHTRNSIYTLQAFFTLILSLVVTYFWGDNGLPYFLLASVLSYLLVILLSIRNIGVDYFLSHSFFCIKTLKDLFNYGIKSHFGNIFKQLSYRIDVLIIAYFLPIKELGLYAVAVTFSELVWKIPDAIGFVLLPTISEKNMKKSYEITAKVSRMILLPMLFVCLFVFVFNEFFLGLLFGNDFIDANICVRFLLPGTFCFSLWKIFVNDLIARGKAVIYSYSAVLSAIVIVGLDLVLVPKIGIIGASIASSLGYIVATLYVVYKFMKYSDLPAYQLFIIRKSEFSLFLTSLKSSLQKFRK
jgi:O-antigen/teichoic acid export membrane protein